MATLANKRRIFPAILKGTTDAMADLSGRVLAIFWVTVIGSLAASATGVIGYLIYSGYALEYMARVMAWACQLNGSCNDFPAMLSGLGVAVVLLAMAGTILLISVAPLPDPSPDTDPASLLTLLLFWYRLGSGERGAMLTMLDNSDTDTHQGLRRILHREHRDLKDYDDC